MKKLKSINREAFITKLEKELSQAKETRSDLERQLEKLKTDYADLEQALKDTQGDLEDAKSERDTALEDAREAEAKADEARADDENGITTDCETLLEILGVSRTDWWIARMNPDPRDLLRKLGVLR